MTEKKPSSTHQAIATLEVGETHAVAKCFNWDVVAYNELRDAERNIRFVPAITRIKKATGRNFETATTHFDNNGKLYVVFTVTRTR